MPRFSLCWLLKRRNIYIIPVFVELWCQVTLESLWKVQRGGWALWGSLTKPREGPSEAGKTGMLPEMPWWTGDNPLGEMTEAAVTGQGCSTRPSGCLTQFQREAVTRESHPGGGDACFQVWGVILICSFVNVSFSQGPELLARSGFTWDLEHIFWGRRWGSEL